IQDFGPLLEQEVRPFGCSLHLLPVDKAFADDLIDCRFHKSRTDGIPMAIAFTKVGNEFLVVYLQPADNSLAQKADNIPPFDRYGKGMRWYVTRLATSSCSSHCFGSWCSRIGGASGGTRRAPCRL